MVARFHYDDSIYQRILGDDLTPRDQSDVTAHIEGCTDCQSRLEAIAEAGIRWEDVRRFLQPEDKSTCRDAGSTTAFVSGETSGAGNVDFLNPSDDPNSLGRFGRYEILEILGRGGMGVVMRGYDPALARHSAIKVLAPELATSASARNRFSREAKSAAAVVHEHVIPIQTVDEERGLPYLVMPVVEGKSLEQRVGAMGPLGLKEVLRIGRQIALGLAAAHAQGLVHRDVKPANILLENGVERVVITDFGLARAMDDANMTQSGIIAGTPQYMSPEQARGNDVDHRSDLFSLGSVLYFMCAGRSPFRAETTMGVLHRITNDIPRSLRTINSDVPVWLQDVIERLLEKDPDRRFQSATEVTDLLGAWLAHVQQPDVAPRPADVGKRLTSNSGERSRWRIRNVAVSLMGGLLFLLAAAVMVLEWNKGTLTIECDSREVAVRIMKGERVYDRMTVTPSDHSVRLAAGQYVVEIEGEYDGLKVEDDVVTVTRGNTQVVRIIQADPSRDGATASTERASAAATSRETNRNEQGASLESAVRQFNEEIAALEPDHVKPSLTVDELVASIRWAMMLRKNDFSPEQITGFEFLLKEQRLPPAWKITHNTRTGPDESDMFTCWSILLQSPEGSHTIRQQMLKQPDKYNSTAVGAAKAAADSIPLAAAIREFNDAHWRNPVGKDQPPLTEEEVVAAIRWWEHRRNEAPLTNAEFAAFQQIADTRSLPQGFAFEVLCNFEPGDGYEYVIWSVRMVMQRTAKPGWTFAFDIRERFVSSRLVDDGTISWGTPAGNGLKAGVQFIPHSGQYARGQKVAVRFFIRNTGDRTLDVSLPNLMTHAYYDQIHVTTPNGEAITLRQDSGPGGPVPVGWRKLRMEPETMDWVNGLPLLIGDESLEEYVETVICAEPGQTCCVSFTLPDFADPDGKPLKTGELRFFVTDKAASAERSVLECEARTKLAELDLREAETELEAVMRRRIAAGDPSVQTEIDKAQLRVARAKIVLDLHTSGNTLKLADGEPTAPQTQSMSNLKQIGRAIHNYHDAQKAFPPVLPQPRKILNGFCTLPSWSSDGSRLAFDFRSPLRGYQVWTVDATRLEATAAATASGRAPQAPSDVPDAKPSVLQRAKTAGITAVTAEVQLVSLHEELRTRAGGDAAADDSGRDKGGGALAPLGKIGCAVVLKPEQGNKLLEVDRRISALQASNKLMLLSGVEAEIVDFGGQVVFL